MIKSLILFLIGIVTFFVMAGGAKASNDICADWLPTIIPTISIEPTVEPTVTVEVTPTVEASPSAEVTQAVTPTVQQHSPHGDGLSDGRESGHRDAPGVPSAPPKTGRAY